MLDAAAGRAPGVTVFGDDYETRDGTCLRDYVHVSDLARAHMLSLHALSSPGVCDTYNLGCGGGYTVREVIDAAAHVTGRRIPITIAPRRPGDPAVLVASSERIKADFGWSPRFEDLAAIIASAWAWRKRHTRRSVA